jgi:adenine specific DNA methylase Mod
MYNEIMSNTLFYGDNLSILQQHIGDASVDLVYLDPPFNSNRDYNVLFREQSGRESPAQIKAFGNPCRVKSWNVLGRKTTFAPSLVG